MKRRSPNPDTVYNWEHPLLENLAKAANKTPVGLQLEIKALAKATGNEKLLLAEAQP